MINLAIIIPAYKSTFLRETLESFKNQTNKDFTLYIGNDCSKENLFEIVKDYFDEIDIVYKEFKTNYGNKNLISHWNRCLNMVQEEEYVCIFSDDDYVDKDYVNNFYQAYKKKKEKVYHYNIKIVNEKSEIIKKTRSFPSELSATKFFLLNNLKKELTARMPEFIFNLDNLRATGGLIDFPLAMRSDNATVMSAIGNSSIHTIPNSYLYWRTSTNNVSSNINSLKLIDLQVSNIEFFNWINLFFYKNKLKNKYRTRRIYFLTKNISSNKYNMKFIDRLKLLYNSIDCSNQKILSFIFFISFYFYRKISSFKGVIH